MQYPQLPYLKITCISDINNTEFDSLAIWIKEFDNSGSWIIAFANSASWIIVFGNLNNSDNWISWKLALALFYAIYVLLKIKTVKLACQGSLLNCVSTQVFPN